MFTAHDIRFLKRVKGTTLNKRKSLIKNADKQQVGCLCRIATNVLKGKLPVRKIAKLKKYKCSLRLLASKKTSLKRRRKVLQSGGFLGALIGAALPLLTSLLIPQR